MREIGGMDIFEANFSRNSSQFDAVLERERRYVLERPF